MNKQLVSAILMITLALSAYHTSTSNAEAQTEAISRTSQTEMEVVRIEMSENVTLLQDGTAKLTLLIRVPSPIGELYLRSLEVPSSLCTNEEIPIPKSMREEFQKSIEEQQQHSLGLIANITDSFMIPRTNLDECIIWMNAIAIAPIVSVTKIDQYDMYEMTFGPRNENETKATAKSIFSTLQLVRSMLRTFTGDQVYKLTWISKFRLPRKSRLLNGYEISDKTWTVDLGGGTVLNAKVSVNGDSVIVLNEETQITEHAIEAHPADIYKAISTYKMFDIKYLTLHSCQDFEKNEQVIKSDDWSYDWSYTWNDKEAYNFTRKYEHIFLNATLTITKSLTISGHVAWDISILPGDFGVKMFESWMQLDVTADLEFEAFANGSYTNTWTKNFFEWTHTFNFFVGVVPVWADAYFTATGYLTLNAYGELQINAGATAYGTFKAGVRWTRENGWSGIWERNIGTTHSGPTMEAEASLWIRTGVRCRLAFLFYSTAGPFIEFEPYATATVNFDYPPPEVEWEITANLRIIAGATFAGWLKGLLGLDDWSTTLYDQQLARWSGSWGPSSISITETLNPSTSLPSSTIQVYGTAILDDGSPVSNADVLIETTQTGASWTTTTDTSGYYSTYISAPNITGTYTVQVSVSTGSLSGSNSKTLYVQDIPDDSPNYQLYRTTTCKDVQPDDPWDPIDETYVFRTNDPVAYTWVHLTDVYIGLNYRFVWYDPDNQHYWSYEDSTDAPPPGEYWSWYKFSAGIYVSGHMPEDMEGRWRCRIYIDEGSGYEIVAIEEFVIRYEIVSVSRTMAKDVDGGVDDPTYPYEPVDPTNKFLNTDPRALGWIRLDEIAESVEVKWEWYDPTGDIDFTWYYTSDDPADEGAFYYTWYKFWGWIGIYGTSRQSKIGRWELRTYVKDVYGNWDLEYSEYFTISENTPPGPPGTPVDDGVYSHTGTVTWTWTESSEDWIIAKYQLQVGTTPGANDVFDGSVGTNLTETFHALPSGHTYYARVRAVNTVGQWGPWSDISDGITIDRPPTTLILDGPDDIIAYNDVFFNWTGSDDLTPTFNLIFSYQLEGYDTGWSPWTAETNRQYYDLPFNNSYIFKVKAKDNIGNVDPTAAEIPFEVMIPRVHDLDTGLGYITIQQAIDAPETLSGHTLFVEDGTYCENLVVRKSLTLIGESRLSTIIDGSEAGNVVNITANNVNITGFTVEKSGAAHSTCGISIFSHSVNISRNIITDNNYGIMLCWDSSNNRISENIVTNNNNGITLDWYCSNNTISDNTIVNNSHGLNLSRHSNFNRLSGNTIMANNRYGIFLYESSNNTISGNNITANSEVGIRVGEEVFSPAPLSSFNNTIQDNKISNNGKGISLIHTSTNTISGNTITNNNGSAISLHDSSYNTISENNIVNNKGNGIYISATGMTQGASYDNTISENNITNNSGEGISLIIASTGFIYGNNITNNDGGIGLYGGEVSFADIHGNHIDANSWGISIQGWASGADISGNTITNNNRTGIDAVGAWKVAISGNNITANKGVGVSLGQWFGLVQSVSGNQIIGNEVGISLKNSESTTIVGNNIENNSKYGIYLEYASSNHIYHNNLINNTQQVSTDSSSNSWNLTYPCCGNFWSDYEGEDIYKGPYQNETGSDGIGDNPYIITINNTDYYPLMYPWPTIIRAQPPVCLDSYLRQSFVVDVEIEGARNLYAYELQLYWNTTLLDLIEVDVEIPLEWGSNYIIPRNESDEDLGRYWLGVSALYPAPSLNGHATLVSLTFNVSYTGDVNADYGKMLTTVLKINSTVLLDSYVYDVYHDVFGCTFNVTLRLIGDIIGPNNGPPDKNVDIRDIAFAAVRFGAIIGDARYDPRADITGPTPFLPDGKIDIRDLALIAKHFGERINP